MQRWPTHAVQEFAQKPGQFAKDEEMVPLMRGDLDAPRLHIIDEIWSRSLRKDAISISNLGGLRNQDLSIASNLIMFDSKGEGFTGRTNFTPRSKQSHGYPVAQM